MFASRSLLAVGALFFAGASGVLGATVTFDCDKVPNICSNDCYAIGCLGFPSTLHRDTSDAAAHRAANECHSGNRCSGNPTDSNSCDEYPYASAEEGGAGAATRCVPAHENSVQGGTLSSFYTRNSIEDGDAYNVAFTNTDGLEYCDGDCDNSGNEVTRRHFLSIRTAKSGIAFNRRYFLTAEGQKILMYEPKATPGSLDKMPGQDLYLAHEDRFVQVARAL